jgi:chemotaxis protein CheD
VILPGEWECCADPTVLTTLLGSCVTVCLWDIRHGVGGMNHFVLPVHPQCEVSPRYGDIAMDRLKSGLEAIGASPVSLRAKVFGGADVLPVRAGPSVGAQNLRFAMQFLNDNGIPIVAHRTGGCRGLQIRFFTRTGDVLFRVIRASAPTERLLRRLDA